MTILLIKRSVKTLNLRMWAWGAEDEGYLRLEEEHKDRNE